MRKLAWVPFTLFFLTSFSPQVPGSPATSSAAPSPQLQPPKASADPLASDEGIRYRQCRPHHWRSLVLQQ